VSFDLDEDLLHEHVDLDVLALDAPDVRFELCAKPGHAGGLTADGPDGGCLRPGWYASVRVGRWPRRLQSSGILIHPCFMA
jgi:hypothetical protein